MAGASYMEVHEAGGGINFTVRKTREAQQEELEELLVERLERMLKAGQSAHEWITYLIKNTFKAGFKGTEIDWMLYLTASGNGNGTESSFMPPHYAFCDFLSSVWKSLISKGYQGQKKKRTRTRICVGLCGGWTKVNKERERERGSGRWVAEAERDGAAIKVCDVVHTSSYCTGRVKGGFRKRSGNWISF